MALFDRQLQDSSAISRHDICNNSEQAPKKYNTNQFTQNNNSYFQHSSKHHINMESSSPNYNDMPYHMLKHRTLAPSLGFTELYTGHFWRSVLSECLSCYLYVFIVCSTRISWTGAIIGHEPNLMAMSLASGLAMMLLIFAFRTVHVNPALSIAFMLTGRISIMRALIYVIVHCLSSVAAIAFLYSISVRGHAGALGLDNPHSVLASWQILIVETVISFIVTLITYAACNYSSYASSRKEALKQISLPSSQLSQYYLCDDTTTTNDDTSNSNCSPHLNMQQHHSRRSVAPIVSQMPSTSISLINTENISKLPNFATAPHTHHHLHNQNSKPDLLGYIEDSNNYDYEYDNHRIYGAQNNQLRPGSSPLAHIEDNMHDECQLLSPNGFSLHVTKGQAFVIGLAYTLTSLTGIPASGASLNPARSFGPAFIMNIWERHWIYWLGPISGAVIAAFFFEFIFNPTSKSSLCYRPKLFRLNAHDIAKAGNKTRLYGRHEQFYRNKNNSATSQKSYKTPTAPLRPVGAGTNNIRVQNHNQHQQNHHPTFQHSSSQISRLMDSNNPITSQLNSRDLQLINTVTGSGVNNQIENITSYLNSGGQTLDPASFVHQHLHTQNSSSSSNNLDRGKWAPVLSQSHHQQKHSNTMHISQLNQTSDTVGKFGGGSASSALISTNSKFEPIDLLAPKYTEL